MYLWQYQSVVRPLTPGVTPRGAGVEAPPIMRWRDPFRRQSPFFGFQPQGVINSITPQGMVDERPFLLWRGMQAKLQQVVPAFQPQGDIFSITPQGFRYEYPNLIYPLPTRATEQEDAPDSIAKAPIQSNEWSPDYSDLFARKPSNDTFQFSDNQLYPNVVVQPQGWNIVTADLFKKVFSADSIPTDFDIPIAFQPQGWPVVFDMAQPIRPRLLSVDGYPVMGNVPSPVTPYGWWPKDFFETLRWWRKANLTVDGYPPIGNVPTATTPYGWWPKDFFETLRWRLLEIGSYNIDAGTPATVYTNFANAGDDQTIFIKRKSLTVDGFMPMDNVASPVTPYGWWPKDFFETFRRKFSPALQQYDWLYEATAAVVTTFPEGWRAEYPVAFQGRRPIPQFDAAGKAAGAIYLPLVVDAPVFRAKRPIAQFDASGKAQDATYLSWVTDTPAFARRRPTGQFDVTGKVADATFLAWAADSAPIRRQGRVEPGQASLVPFPGQPQGWAPWFDGPRLINRRPGQFDSFATFLRRDVWGWSAEFPNLIVRRRQVVDSVGQPPTARFQETWAATYFDMPRRPRRQFVEGFPSKGENVYPFAQGPQGWQPNFHWIIKHPIIPPDYARNYPRSGVPIIWKPSLVAIKQGAQLVGDDQTPSLDGIKTTPTLVGEKEGDDLTGIDRDPSLVGKVGE